MARPGDRSYAFTADGHWRAGAMQGFAASGGALTVRELLKAERIEACEAGVAAATGPCGRLVWLDPATGELVVLHSWGAEPQGRIASHDAKTIYAGPASQAGRQRVFVKNPRSILPVPADSCLTQAQDCCSSTSLARCNATAEA